VPHHVGYASEGGESTYYGVLRIRPAAFNEFHYPPEFRRRVVDLVEGDRKVSVLLYSNGSKLMIDIAGRRGEIDDEEIASKLWFVWLGSRSVTPTLNEDIAERAGL